MEYEDDDESNEIDQRTQADILKLEVKIDQLDDACRKIGVYLDRATVTVVPGPTGEPQPVIMADFTIGDVAFTTRVQNPEQDKINKQFAEMTFGYNTDEFLNMRERMKRNIAEGRNPMDDGKQ